MKKFKIRMPGRINILGNPSDANEGAHQTISAAVNLWGEAAVEESERLGFAMTKSEESGEPPLSAEFSSFEELAYGRGFDLQVAAAKTLYAYSPELREKAGSPRFPAFAFSTQIPRQSGLGGSTVLVLLAMFGLVKFYELDPRKHNEYVLAELAQRAEEKELGITCGFADRYVPLFGDISYIDYRGKLFHLPIKEEPYCTYEKLGKWVSSLPLVLCSTGVPHDSGDVHKPMRARYLDEYRAWKKQGGEEPFMVRVMREAGATAWRGKIALLEGDLHEFGRLMNENHRLVDEMMRYCGFSAGAGEANNRMIEAGREAGALGAKLTGAGGGGSVFMLAEPGREEELASALKDALEKNGYGNGRVIIPEIVRECPVVEEL